MPTLQESQESEIQLLQEAIDAEDAGPLDTAPSNTHKVPHHPFTEGVGMAPEPGTAHVGQIHQDSSASEGDALAPPAAISSIKSAGWTYVFHRGTGDPSLCNNNMILAQLRKIDNDPVSPTYQQKAFTTRDPGFRPKRGEFVCLMHKDSPRRNEMDDKGFQVCIRTSIHSEYDLINHMRSRHPREYAIIEDELLDEEKHQDRTIARRTMEAMERIAEVDTDAIAMEANLTSEAVDGVLGSMVDSDPEQSSSAEQLHIPENWDMGTDGCPHCEWTSGARKRSGRISSVKIHIKNEHEKVSVTTSE